MLAWLPQTEGKLLLFLQEYVRCTPLSIFLVPLTLLGECGMLWILCSLLMLCFKRSRRAGFAGLLALFFCFIINNLILKNWVDRPRPYTQIEGLWTLVTKPSDASFPSGHTNAAFASAVAYWHTLDMRWLKVVLLALAAAMAFSRLYVGVHYPTDVLGGILVGSVGSTLVCAFLKRYSALRRGQQEPS